MLGADATGSPDPERIVIDDSSSTEFSCDSTDQFAVQAGAGAVIYSSSDLSTGVELAADGGSLSSPSTRIAKIDIIPIDPTAVLDTLHTLEILTCAYEVQDNVTHMDPMAKQFHDAFGLGADDQRIAIVNADGVVLAAIQGLSERLDEKDERIGELEAENETLHERNAELEARLARVETHLGPDATNGQAASADH